jgi:hypothetical protein
MFGMHMKTLKLINLIALLFCVAWVMSNADWEPRITLLTLFAAIVGLEYAEERRRLRDPDIQLYKEFIQTLPSSGDIEYLRTIDLGGLIDSTRLQQVKRFFYEWKDAEHEFVNRGLERKRKALYAAIDAFLIAYARHVFHENNEFYRVPREWEQNDPERYHAAVNELNKHADMVFESHQELVRAARKRLKVGEPTNGKPALAGCG